MEFNPPIFFCAKLKSISYYVSNEVLSENSEQAKDYDPSNPKALDYFIGQIMKKTRGKANPSIASKIMKEKLDNMNK